MNLQSSFAHLVCDWVMPESHAERRSVTKAIYTDASRTPKSVVLILDDIASSQLTLTAVPGFTYNISTHRTSFQQAWKDLQKQARAVARRDPRLHNHLASTSDHDATTMSKVRLDLSLTPFSL